MEDQASPNLFFCSRISKDSQIVVAQLHSLLFSRSEKEPNEKQNGHLAAIHFRK